MIAGNSSQNANGSIPAKRSLFNKPSWSRPQALSNGTDLFHRSNQTYVDAAAEAQRQRQKKIARKERERARRADSEAREGKRQRVSESDDDDEDESSSEEGSHCSEDLKTQISSVLSKSGVDTHVSIPSEPRCSPKSLLKRYEATVDAKKVQSNPKQDLVNSCVIDLEDEDDVSALPEDSAEATFMTTKATRPPVQEEDPVSDEEFPELARKARERARRKRLEEDMASGTPDRLPASQDGDYELSQTVHISTPPPLPPPSDPVLQILITSRMPDTTPLIVNRKLSQRLKDVRLAWVERQRFPSDLADKVFLTWRGKRLFDVTSCKSLGITAGPNGRILARGDNVVDDEGRIHMEAMTLEILEAHKKALNNELPDKVKDTEQDTAPSPQKRETQEEQVKIICKGRGFPDFKLIVKPSTIISKICNAFRSQNKISADKEVYLMFDGERLSHESKVGDTELSDMDTVDVVVK